MSSLYKQVRGTSLGGPDIGETYYLIDSDYRTAAQGWSQSDRTGPLDLYAEKNPGRVVATADYTRDQLAVQAGIDALVDFRGDALFFAPGSITIGTTALNLNVPDARYLGPTVRNPRTARVTITDAIGDNSFAAAADRNEIGFIRFVPLTAQNTFVNVSGSVGGWIHDCFYDSTGVAANDATEFFLTVATSTDWMVERCDFVVDAAQGDAFTFVNANRWIIQDCNFINQGPTITWASVVTFVTTASRGMVFKNCYFGSGGGANCLITNVFTGMAGGSILSVQRCIMDGTSTPTAGNIETGFDATVGIELVETYITGDATTQGGVLIVLT